MRGHFAFMAFLLALQLQWEAVDYYCLYLCAGSDIGLPRRGRQLLWCGRAFYCNIVTMTGNYNFHYDEALNLINPPTGYLPKHGRIVVARLIWERVGLNNGWCGEASPRAVLAHRPPFSACTTLASPNYLTHNFLGGTACRLSLKIIVGDDVRSLDFKIRIRS